MSNNIDELRCITDINDTTIAIITESWLSNDIPTTAISLKDNYNTYRKDRVNCYGGGVVAYIKSDLKSKRLLNLEDEEREVLWLKLFPKRTLGVIVVLLLPVFIIHQENPLQW